MLKSGPVLYLRDELMSFDAGLVRAQLISGLQQLTAADVLPESANAAIPEQLLSYLQLLAKWNRAYNLTAVRDPGEMVTRHLLDSLTANRFLRGARILDAGAGAGLPGIPLALANPDREFTLLDANGKKVRFVQHVIGELGIDNAVAVQSRAEQWVTEEPYDTVISRAFCSLRDFVSNCGGLVAATGCLLAMKGRYPQAELADLPAGWAATAIKPVTVPGLQAERHLVILER